MLVFNQQANIKNVNGAIADIFANRPAPQSTFYLFYSTDTQEIYYDNGTWILIGSGGGVVNIYNSDGTLTGNRVLQGANNSLTFQDCSTISLQTFGNNKRFVIDNVKEQYINLSFINLSSGINNGFRVEEQQIKSYSNGFNNIIGLKLDFANNTYTLGDPGSFNNASTLIIDDNNREIITRFNTGNEGIEISQTTYLAKFGWLNSLNNNHIEFDQTNNVTSTYIGNNRLGLEFDYNTNIFKIGDVNSVANNNYLEIDDTTQLINLGKPGNIQLVIDNSVTQTFKTLFNGNDIGLKLDFAQQEYFLGDNSLGSGCYAVYGNNLQSIATNNSTDSTVLNHTINSFYTQYNGNDVGLKLDFANGLHSLGQNDVGILADVNNQQTIIGDFNNTNNLLKLIVDDLNTYIKTSFLGNDIGLKLDFANNIYQLGDLQNIISYNLDLNTKTFYFGDCNSTANGTQFFLSDSSSEIYTTYGGNFLGLKLDFANQTYQLGQLTGGNESVFIVDDSNELIYTTFGGNSNGITIDLASNSFIFGRITGSNTTNLTINDGATYPVEINGTNVLSGTSGGSSGQHLKIKINGVDYKIELKNP